MSTRPLVYFLTAALTACAARPAPTPNAPEPRRPPERARAEPTLAPLSREEAELTAELGRRVRELAGKIGERNPARKWEYASASDWVAHEFEEAGYSIERQGYEVDDEVVAQNLIVEVRGTDLGQEVVLVGSHYDSARGSPGANDAAGVAALIALAQRFRSEQPRRTLRFAAFALRHEPFYRTPRMGSLVYAREAIARGDQIVAMIGLDSLGYFSQRPGSQSRPGELARAFPETATFAAVVGDNRSRDLVGRLTRSLARSTSLPVRGAVLEGPVAGLAESDPWAFTQLGIPSVMVTDTNGLRNPDADQSGDTPDKLDYQRMARLVTAIAGGIRELVEASRPAPRAPTDYLLPS